MLKKQVALALVVFLALVFDTSLYARGLTALRTMTGSRSAFGTARSTRFSCE